MTRSLGVGVRALLLLSVVLLAACSGDEPDPNALAVAKCQLPLHQRLGIVEGTSLSTTDVGVREAGEDRREVTGAYTLAEGAGGGRYSCVVVPDASDQLRGLRVERLDVEPLPG